MDCIQIYFLKNWFEFHVKITKSCFTTLTKSFKQTLYLDWTERKILIRLLTSTATNYRVTEYVPVNVSIFACRQSFSFISAICHHKNALKNLVEEKIPGRCSLFNIVERMIIMRTWEDSLHQTSDGSCLEEPAHFLN